MPGKKANGELVVPTLNLVKAIDPLCTELLELTREAEAVNVFNPFSAFRSLPPLTRRKDILQSRYDKELAQCYDCLGQAVSGPGWTMGFAQAWSTAKGTSAILRLQDIWNALGAVLDRKYAYSFAILSFYLAIFSLLLSIIFGVLTMNR